MNQKAIQTLLQTPTTTKSKALEFLKMFQSRLVSNTFASQMFFTNLADLKNAKKMYNVSTFQSPFEGYSFLQALLSGEMLEFNPRSFDKMTTESINNLFLSNLNFKKESGYDSVYLGWPFCFGTVKKELKPEPDDNGQMPTIEEFKEQQKQYVFCGPLLLWKVKVVSDELTGIQTIQLVTDDEDKPVVLINNEIFVRALANNNITGKHSATSLGNSFSDVALFAKKVMDTFKDAGFNMPQDEEQRLVDILSNFNFSDYQPINVIDNLDALQGYNFMISDSAILGLFIPSSASGNIYFDYNEMMSGDGVTFMADLHNSICDTLKLSKESGKIFPESMIREIIPLDYSQKKAAHIAINNSIVIQGPPGTGKSQTISNIIANYINLCRSCLFVTEKKTAAGVVYNRLNRLRAYCLKFYEADTDTLEITRQLQTGLSRIRQLYGASAIGDTTVLFDSSSMHLDEIFKRLQKFNMAMHSAEGTRFPDFVYKFNDNWISLYGGLKYVREIISSFTTARDFWAFVKKTVDDSNIFKQLKAIQASLAMTDKQFTMFVDLAPIYDGTPDKVVKSIPYYLKYNEILEDVAEMADEVKAKKFKNDEDYKVLVDAFNKIDEYTVYTLCSKDAEWFNKFNTFATQPLYTNILEFDKRYDAENFDFDLASDLPKLTTFLNNNVESLQSDNSEWHKEINDLLEEKQRDDLITCETNFIRNVIKVLDANPIYYQQFNELFAYVNSIDKIKNLQLILQKYNKVITLCFPVIISSPHATSALLPAKHGLFDYVVIDEASQLSIEKAIPIIFRGKRFAVLGDRKQTPPVDSYEESAIDIGKDKAKTIEDKIEHELMSQVKSLIDYVMQKVQTTTLDFHYRSAKKELINFSNMVFYNGKLNVCDAPVKTAPALHVNTLDNATNNNGVNEQEANLIVKKITELCETPGHGSIGVITMTQEQSDYITFLLYNSKSRFVLNELHRFDGASGQDQSLFIRTIEDVQGEERDNIFVSVVWTRAPQGKLTSGFGPITSGYGANRINVMASRAKENMFIIKSFNAMDIDSDLPSVLIFKKYLEYVEVFDRIRDINSPEIANMFAEYTRDIVNIEQDIASKSANSLATDIGEALEPFLPTVFKLRYHHKEGNFNIGIVIEDTRTNSFPIGIVCDNFEFDPTVPAQQRDFYAQHFLELKGWRFFRVSTLQWCKKRIEMLLFKTYLDH